MKETARTAVVTGGAGGLGTAISTVLAEAGHRVVITYHHGAERAEKLAAELAGAGHHAVALPFDLLDPNAAGPLVAAVGEQFGPVEILVNNGMAAQSSPEGFTAFVEEADADWQTSVRGAVEGTLGLTKAVLPAMVAGGWGRVVFISSGLVRTGMPGSVAYVAGKAALHGAAKSLAWEVGPAGVTVNTVLPGLIVTEKLAELAKLRSGLVEGMSAQTPTGRLVTPAEVAAGVAFFASAAASGVTGQELLVDGGRH